MREGGEKPGRFFGEWSTPKAFGAVTRGGQSLGRRERDLVGRPELRRSVVNLKGNAAQTGGGEGVSPTEGR